MCRAMVSGKSREVSASSRAMSDSGRPSCRSREMRLEALKIIVAIDAMATNQSLGRPQQTQLLVISQRPGGQAGSCRDLADPPPRLGMIIHTSTVELDVTAGSSLCVCPCRGHVLPVRLGLDFTRGSPQPRNRSSERLHAQDFGTAENADCRA